MAQQSSGSTALTRLSWLAIPLALGVLAVLSAVPLALLGQMPVAVPLAGVGILAVGTPLLLSHLAHSSRTKLLTAWEKMLPGATFVPQWEGPLGTRLSSLQVAGPVATPAQVRGILGAVDPSQPRPMVLDLEDVERGEMLLTQATQEGQAQMLGTRLDLLDALGSSASPELGFPDITFHEKFVQGKDGSPQSLVVDRLPEPTIAAEAIAAAVGSRWPAPEGLVWATEVLSDTALAVRLVRGQSMDSSGDGEDAGGVPRDLDNLFQSILGDLDLDPGTVELGVVELRDGVPQSFTIHAPSLEDRDGDLSRLTVQARRVLTEHWAGGWHASTDPAVAGTIRFQHRPH